jgi:hypothetical protein
MSLIAPFCNRHRIGSGVSPSAPASVDHQLQPHYAAGVHGIIEERTALERIGLDLLKAEFPVAKGIRLLGFRSPHLLCLSAARRGTQPRGSGTGPHQATRDGAEQCALRAARRQLDANARDMFDHARSDLDQALAERRELATGERVGLWDR